MTIGQKLLALLATYKTKVIPLPSLAFKPHSSYGIITSQIFLICVSLAAQPTLKYLKLYKWKKLDARSHHYIFIGYGVDQGVKGYRLYDPSTKKISFNRNVTFDEETILGALTSTPHQDNSQPLLPTPTSPALPKVIDHFEDFLSSPTMFFQFIDLYQSYLQP